jgi:hypothetical protein
MSRRICLSCNGWGRLGIHGNAFPLMNPQFDPGGLGMLGRVGLVAIALAMIAVLTLAALYYLPNSPVL